MAFAIPASVVSDTSHMRERALKIGLIGRAAAIFRINEIIVYPDNMDVNQSVEMDLVAKLLRYMETPQYLRKSLFKIEPDLQYAGMLPPLRTPHHPLDRRMKALKVGEYREGVAVSRTKEGTLVDIGVEQPALLPHKQCTLGNRVTVKVTGVEELLEVGLADRDDVSDYWGYIVTVERLPLGSVLRRRCFDVTVATSRYGVSFAGIVAEIVEKWRASKTALVAFGAPAHGLKEILNAEGLGLNDTFDYVVNTIPNQGTATVRTEEALVASMAVLNLALAPC